LAAYFFDSSALAKLYHPEVGTAEGSPVGAPSSDVTPTTAGETAGSETEAPEAESEAEKPVEESKPEGSPDETEPPADASQ
jgi:hypothetical protein